MSTGPPASVLVEAAGGLAFDRPAFFKQLAPPLSSRGPPASALLEAGGGLAFDRPAFFKQLLHSVPEVCSVCLADDGLTTKITRPPFLTVTLFFN